MFGEKPPDSSTQKPSQNPKGSGATAGHYVWSLIFRMAAGGANPKKWLALLKG